MNGISAASREDGATSRLVWATLEELGRALTPHVVAIDGPGASGKSTVGHAVARVLDYLYFDTGAMYRAVTWTAMTRGIAIQDEAEVSGLAAILDIDILPPAGGHGDGRNSVVLVDAQEITEQIRRPDVDQNVSVVSAYAQVREAMSRQQQKIGQRYGNGRAEKAGVVMVGRDIGTVIMPDAPVKVYLDASVEERARRRTHELAERGKPIDFEQVLADLMRRDEIDSGRALSPLRVAQDAVVLDTSAMSVEQVVEAVLRLVGQVVSSQKAGQRQGDDGII